MRLKKYVVKNNLRIVSDIKELKHVNLFNIILAVLRVNLFKKITKSVLVSFKALI